MAKTEKSVWLKHGYDLFAAHGHAGLKVEVLARKVGKSKSSFYHHFSDVEAFITLLLKLHVQRAYVMAEELEALVGSTNELSPLLVSFADDILFHRQLRFHRQIPEYQQCIGEVMILIEPPFVELLSDMLELSDNKAIVRLLLSFCIDHFLMRTTADLLTVECIHRYIQEVFQLLKQLRSNSTGLM